MSTPLVVTLASDRLAMFEFGITAESDPTRWAALPDDDVEVTFQWRVLAKRRRAGGILGHTE